MSEKQKTEKFFNKKSVVQMLCALIVGLLIGAGVMLFVNGGTKLASVKGKTITSNDVYR